VSRLYARVARLRRAQEEKPVPRIDPRAAGDDEQRLRNLPVIGRGCGGGAIPGTRPGSRLRGK
jgi:hypothetical protein